MSPTAVGAPPAAPRTALPHGPPYAPAPSVSTDGRSLAVGSEASDLLPGDVHQVADVFARHRAR
ncbi:hypothetical protein [Streptomyces youssoufiensis]